VILRAVGNCPPGAAQAVELAVAKMELKRLRTPRPPRVHRGGEHAEAAARGARIRAAKRRISLAADNGTGRTLSRGRSGEGVGRFRQPIHLKQAV